MDIGLQRLRAFAETARLGSMTAAATALGFTTGAVSQQISSLERDVGRRLFDRVGRGLQLTESGSVFLHYANQILLAELEAAAALAGPWQPGQPRIQVRLGIFGSLAAVALAPATAALDQRHAGVEIRSIELDVDAAADAVRRGRVDLALGIDYPRSPARPAEGVERVLLATEALSVAVPSTSPLTGSTTLDEFADAPWIMAPPHTHFGFAVRSMCRRAGFEPTVIHEVADTGACLAMAAAGLGVTAATPMMLDVRPERLTLPELRDSETRDIVLFTPSGVSVPPAREHVEDALRQAMHPYERRSAPSRRHEGDGLRSSHTPPGDEEHR